MVRVATAPSNLTSPCNALVVEATKADSTAPCADSECTLLAELCTRSCRNEPLITLGSSTTMNVYGRKRDEAALMKSFIWDCHIKMLREETPGSGLFGPVHSDA